MSKLYNVLDSMIARMKDAVSYSEVQELTDEEKAQARENIGAGVPQVQADWNQNDETAVDYVKNRPFWTDDIVETILLEEISVDTTDDWWELYSAVSLVAGQEYIVVYDDTEYKVIAQDDGEGNVYIGSTSLWWDNGYNETEPPFVLGNEWINAYPWGEHTIKVIGNIAEIHKIDPKYIQDMYYQEPSVKDSFLDEQTLTFSDQSSEGGFYNDTTTYSSTISDFTYADRSWIVDGDATQDTIDAETAFIVVWDGVEYECVCHDGDGIEAFILGNPYLCSNNKNNTDEPFCIIADVWYDTQGLYIIANDTAESHTVEVYHIEDGKVHTIDTKYLPPEFGDSFNELYDAVNSVQTTANNKMNAANPVGTGSFSMNRKSGTTVGSYSHAEGNNTTASGSYSHAEGYNTKATTSDDSVSATTSTSKGYCTHAEGYGTVAYGAVSHAEGNGTKASGEYSHAEGRSTTASSTASHAEGQSTKASSTASHAEGQSTKASGDYSHAEGCNTEASGQSSHAEGNNTTASGQSSHAEGNNTTASGSYSHAEGQSTTASGVSSHAEGQNTTASGDYSHAEGQNTTASGDYSHAEGYKTKASGNYSHAEGCVTKATSSSNDSVVTTDFKTNGYYTHAEGYGTVAYGAVSHAEGNGTKASGIYSHAEGYGTTAQCESQHVQGEYNILDTGESRIFRGKYAHIVGNGTSDTARSNAHTLDWSGNAWYQGTVEGTGFILPSSTADSTKRFKITVDDNGTLTATEITE